MLRLNINNCNYLGKVLCNLKGWVFFNGFLKVEIWLVDRMVEK